MFSTLMDKSLTSGKSVLKSLRARDFEEICRERLDQITAFAMVTLAVVYAAYVFVL
jgi:hypothetical protein